MNARDDLRAEQNALLFVLGMKSEPVYLDIKPPDFLTTGERQQFGERLEVVTERLGGWDDPAQFT